MDLNKFRDAVRENGEGKGLDGGTIKVQPKGATYQRYLDFKFETTEVREAIAKENDSTPEKYEASLLMLAKLRKEVPEEEKKEGGTE
jgi:hypothetical protein